LSGTLVTGLEPSVVISVVGGAVLETISAPLGIGYYESVWQLPVLDRNQQYRITVRVGGHDLTHRDLYVDGNGLLRQVLTDAYVTDLSFATNLRIKFRLLQ
jgi:hypothetical protein